MFITNLISKHKNRRAKKELCEYLYQVYINTDYSNYEISVSFNAEERTLLIPAPVMALSIVDDELSEWIAERIENLSAERVLVA